MKVFIAGGTGYLGSVLVEHLIRAGHEVTALSRSETSGERLQRAGARPVAGSLSDITVLSAAAAQADAIIHAAVDYSMTEESNATELAAVAALVHGAGSTGKPVVFTSTGLVYGFDPDQDVTEDAVLPKISAQPVKVAAEQIVLAAPGIAAIVIRAGLIFGRGGSALVTGLIQSALHTGVATYVDEGINTWLPVHVDDLADLYTRAVAHPTPGIYNAVGVVPFAFRDLAEAVGDLTGTPVTSVPLTVAEQGFGPAARILTTSSRLVASKARQTFRWAPSTRSLADDVRSGSYASLVSEAQ